MKISLLNKFFVAGIVPLAAISSASAASLMLDFQPTGGTTADGYLAYEVTNQNPPAAGTDYSAFGSTVTVSISSANLRGNTDLRSVARNGAATDVVNDWVGVDARGLLGATFTINVAGLPLGDYTWASQHHDGGAGATNGNIFGENSYMFTDAAGTASGVSAISSQNEGDAISVFSRSFSSNGSDPVSMSISSTGAAPGAIFAFTDSLVIADAVPEPSTAFLALLGFATIGLRRRR